MTNEVNQALSPSTIKKSSLMQELSSSRASLEDENAKLRKELSQANDVIAQLQKEMAALKSASSSGSPTPRNDARRERRNSSPTTTTTKGNGKNKSKMQQEDAATPKRLSNKFQYVVPHPHAE